MGVFDKFLDIMKLNDDDYDDDEFYDDDDFADDGDFEEKPRRSFFGKKNNKEESFNDFDADEDKTFQPSASSKVTPMRPAAKHGGNMEVCVVKPTSVDDSREITETLLAGRTVILNLEVWILRSHRELLILFPEQHLRSAETFRRFPAISSLLHLQMLIFPVIFRIFSVDLWKHQVFVEDTRI